MQFNTDNIENDLQVFPKFQYICKGVCCQFLSINLEQFDSTRARRGGFNKKIWLEHKWAGLQPTRQEPLSTRYPAIAW